MKGGMKASGMTAEEIRKAASDKLFIGKKVKLLRQYHEENKKAVVEKKSGTVIGMYPYIFTVDFGNYKESFRYGQLFGQGNEVVRV